MDIDDQQSIRSSSSIELVDQDDELGEDFKQNLDEISADKDSSDEQKTIVAEPCDQCGNPEQEQQQDGQQQQEVVQCQQQMSSLNLDEEQHQPSQTASDNVTAEVSQEADCPLNLVALVEVHRSDNTDHHNFKYEFDITAGAGLPTVEKMLCTVLLDHLDQFESMEQLSEQFELLKVQYRDHRMENKLDWNAGTGATKLFLDLSKKQQREQKVQDSGEYRVVLRPKSVSANPPADKVQSTRSSISSLYGYVADEPQLMRVDPTDQPSRQQNSDQTAPRSSMHRYVLSDGVQLGQLYSALTDNIISDRSFDSPAGTWSNNFQRIAPYFVIENPANVDQRLQMFDPEQKISMMCKLTEFDEHNVLSNFLRHAETTGSSNTNSFGIVCASPTKTFELFRDAEQLLLAQQTMVGFDSTDGTHTIRAITYGFIIGAIFKMLQPQQKTTKKPLKDVQKLVVKGLNNQPLSEAEKSLFGTLDTSKVMVTVFSNNNGPYDCVKGKQMSVRSALELFEAATRKAKKANVSNGDVGHPISCELMKLGPIIGGDQRQQPQREAAVANLFDRIKMCIERVEKVEHDNKSLQANVDESAHCLKEEEWQKIKELGTEFDRIKATFGRILQDAILQFRDDADHGGNMALLGEEQLGLDAIQHLHQQIRNYMKAIASNKAVTLFRNLKKEGVRYIGRGNTTLEAELAKTVDVGGQNKSNSSIVLFWNQEQVEHGDPDSKLNAQECCRLFGQLITAHGETYCMMVDLSLAALPQAVADIVGNTCSTRLVKFAGTTAIVADYLQEEKRKRTVCVARREVGVMVALVDGTDKKLLDLVVMPCLNAMSFNASNSNNTTTHSGAGADADNCPDNIQCWECDECSQYMRLDKSDLSDGKELWFYCECGRVLVSSLRFRCPSCVAYNFGGRPFVAPTMRELRACLRENLGKKRKNILVVGETGVGKSTLINALANYMTYGSLADAIQSNGPPVCLIPAEFTITDEQFRPRIVRLGGGFNQAYRDDERHIVDKECVQNPHTYVFNYLGGELRLIDTVGIGDADGGIEQDKRNFNALLNYLSNIGELHGICILLHPNQSKLSTLLRCFIHELFCHLHHIVGQNIVFCFTNVRGTLYKPGNTLPPLREFLVQLGKNLGVQIELDQRTMYCMDNESFRFLCAVKDGVQFSSDDFPNFEASWRRAESETRRMLEYLNELKVTQASIND